MIITNFLIFIIAILIYTTGSEPSVPTYPPIYSFFGVFVLLLAFWNFNRSKFMRLKTALKDEVISIHDAKRNYPRMINRNIIYGLIIFGVEIYALDLKRAIVLTPGLGSQESLINIAGLGIFISHLVMVWYWAFKAMGDTVSMGKSTGSYIRSNIKFNLVIAIPWILLTICNDLLNLVKPGLMDQLKNSDLFNFGFLGIFLILFTVFGPALVTRFWDCKPLEDIELKHEIEMFAASQGVKFKKIMSWNALNGSMVTAGVMGLISSFRYLMITPELINILDKDELMCVVSHEVGHVKKRHLVYYLLFFFGFFVLGIKVVEWAILFTITILPESLINIGLFAYIQAFLMLFLMVLYFRFIFGYFMRNFEREADVFCFECGVDPNSLVTSFMKLGVQLEDDNRKSNWHHFNIGQRIDFIRTCMENPGEIVKHKKKVNRSVLIFSVSLVLLTALSLFWTPRLTLDLTNMNSLEKVIRDRIEETPNNPDLYAALGDVSYQLQKWKDTQTAYEKSIALKYNQPEVLNNLAWMYLMCPDKKFLDPKRALTLAKDAAALSEATHIYDTLAEANFQNSMYKEAFIASQKALLMAVDNLDYYRKQTEKMKKYAERFKNMISI